MDELGANRSIEPGWRIGRPITNGDRLFVYGTLQFPEVLVELIGRCPELIAAELTGWRAAVLPGRVYPGLVPVAAGVARGVVLSGLGAADWAVLDAFEDDEYELRRVRPATMPSAWTYVWTSVVTQDDWFAEQFAAEHLGAFVTHCAAWRRSL
ncbi:gamma-glutamylcyclotransferase family protein [Nocardia sp. R16R-3T]